MGRLDDYKELLGRELLAYLDGKISFEELQDRISDFELNSVAGDNFVKLVWHAIYQFELDRELEDLSSVSVLNGKLRKIAEAMINNDSQVQFYIKEYFNAP